MLSSAYLCGQRPNLQVIPPSVEEFFHTQLECPIVQHVICFPMCSPCLPLEESVSVFPMTTIQDVDDPCENSPVVFSWLEKLSFLNISSCTLITTEFFPVCQCFPCRPKLQGAVVR